jgi:micrococcal nuclease
MATRRRKKSKVLSRIPKSVRHLGIAAFLAAIATWWVAGPDPTLASGCGLPSRGQVVKITDGDTVHVDRGKCGKTIVRPPGVDTPETKKPGVKVQCGGPQATAYAQRTLANQTVTLVEDAKDIGTDPYGRKLLHIQYGSDAQDYGLSVIRAGWARANNYGHPGELDVTYRQAEAQARRERLGVWRLCPAPFRR